VSSRAHLRPDDAGPKTHGLTLEPAGSRRRSDREPESGGILRVIGAGSERRFERPLGGQYTSRQVAHPAALRRSSGTHVSMFFSPRARPSACSSRARGSSRGPFAALVPETIPSSRSSASVARPIPVSLTVERSRSGCLGRRRSSNPCRTLRARTEAHSLLEGNKCDAVSVTIGDGKLRWRTHDLVGTNVSHGASAIELLEQLLDVCNSHHARARRKGRSLPNSLREGRTGCSSRGEAPKAFSDAHGALSVEPGAPPQHEAAPPLSVVGRSRHQKAGVERTWSMPLHPYPVQPPFEDFHSTSTRGEGPTVVHVVAPPGPRSEPSTTARSDRSTGCERHHQICWERPGLLMDPFQAGDEDEMCVVNPHFFALDASLVGHVRPFK
jgi:hypothetical protein